MARPRRRRRRRLRRALGGPPPVEVTIEEDQIVIRRAGDGDDATTTRPRREARLRASRSSARCERRRPRRHVSRCGAGRPFSHAVASPTAVRGSTSLRRRRPPARRRARPRSDGSRRRLDGHARRPRCTQVESLQALPHDATRRRGAAGSPAAGYAMVAGADVRGPSRRRGDRHEARLETARAAHRDDPRPRRDHDAELAEAPFASRGGLLEHASASGVAGRC